jgi:secreted trypsin-like serine protease
MKNRQFTIRAHCSTHCAVNVIDANAYVMESIVETKKPSRCNCGRKKFPDRILGGDYTDEHEHPWVVEVSIGCVQTNITGFMPSICGGSVISKRHVLTAAHCFLRGISAQ